MEKTCCNCGLKMREGLAEWHWQCNSCGYEAACFDPAINNEARHLLVDEARRENALKSLRLHNFRELLQTIRKNIPDGQYKLLDVGAAHGWFVNMVADHFDAYGIEPDHVVCQSAQAQGVALIEGYFPDVLSESDRFDVITFNDVFEHMPDPGQTLTACKNHLNERGILVLNLPSSTGFFYTLSRRLKRLGFASAFDRMWQKGFPSPHLHYFNSTNLIKLTEQYGFETIYSGSLPSVCLNGLYERIAYVGSRNKLRNFCMWLFTAITIPFINLFSSDVIVVIARKQG